jgi:hypothetical protein
MSRLHMAAMDRLSAALTGMRVQEWFLVREKDSEETARRGAEALRWPIDVQDELIDGALDEHVPRGERRDG